MGAFSASVNGVQLAGGSNQEQRSVVILQAKTRWPPARTAANTALAVVSGLILGKTLTLSLMAADNSRRSVRTV